MSKNATQTALTLVAPTAGSLKRQMEEVICEQPSRSPIPDILTNDEAAFFLRVSPTFSTHRANCHFFEGRGLQGRVNTTETISNPL